MTAPIQMEADAPVDFIPLLKAGDRLSRDEFERRYEAMPDVKKAELIEGVVYMPSPVTANHSEPHFDLIVLLGIYTKRTPGVRGGDNGTVRLDLSNEPQPDVYLRILPEYGGQTHLSSESYVVDAPELVAEIAHTSVRLDLREKFEAYQRNGVREYIVWRVDDRELDWFVLRGDHFERLPVAADGCYHSETFPGLWIDPVSLVSADFERVEDGLRRGLTSPEHAAFVEQLRGKKQQDGPTHEQ